MLNQGKITLPNDRSTFTIYEADRKTLVQIELFVDARNYDQITILINDIPYFKILEGITDSFLSFKLALDSNDKIALSFSRTDDQTSGSVSYFVHGLYV